MTNVQDQRVTGHSVT